MGDEAPHNTALRFETFRLDQRSGLSRRAESGHWQPIALGFRAQAMLWALAEQQGRLVTKRALMDAVWPEAAVEESNLTVQMTSLRRVLDEGRTGSSCIQTIIGRGYRFQPEVTRETDDAHAPHPEVPPQGPVEVGDVRVPPGDRPTAHPLAGLGAGSHPRFWVLMALVASLIVSFGLGAFVVLRTGQDGRISQVGPPRLSMIVIPFQNLGGNNDDDHLADGITDDLTSDLSHIHSAFVIARASARTFKGKPVDVRRIGQELGVRYVLEGSVRRIGTTLRVNAWLSSSETGEHLWSDRFDEQIADLTTGQDAILARIRGALKIDLVEIEVARGLRDRPTDPDAFDLVMRARSILSQVPTRERQDAALTLLEQALQLDPRSVQALAHTAFLLMEKNGYPGWNRSDAMRRAERLLNDARSIAPGSELVMNYTVQWLRRMDRFQEAMAVAEELVRRYPNNPAGYFDLAQSRTAAGQAEDALPLSEKAILLDPRSPWLFNRYRDMGRASTLLGRDTDAVTFLERSLSINPGFYEHQWTYRFLAASYARSGRMPEARKALSEADRLFPYDTVRSHWPDNPSSSVFAQQVRQLQAALRLAGERDHADEDANFNIPIVGELHSIFAGFTPMAIVGATTIRSPDLVRLLDESRPVVIDTMSYSWGRSIPGAIGLRSSGLAGSFTDAAQNSLRDKLRELTGGDLSKPIVAVGWNSERFDGCNLALRLVALGYTNVYWYRGGREAWEVNGLPETEVDIQEW
jgi:TolB-like protein/DNA-binding winged helix-turn-helix (wHTH) protein/rhodanese-related sulfurtransferase/cytochrome c-type biogenesis protein CcmH/NrfG